MGKFRVLIHVHQNSRPVAYKVWSRTVHIKKNSTVQIKVTVQKEKKEYENIYKYENRRMKIYKNRKIGKWKYINIWK